ncbi:MAG: Dam family site-specific DNA-(adenine-N6)-methyltransferase [Spirobacillus cienkowskii]|jgi:DNA adenine methylase|uniref:Site-specific DNA-methyltransferase (adenine-specific) n=1 Tax=Spirobacillus cienkowskii TaxID=495820 RepID=A0A369KR33_9BACT|nr:MAG: Dam family site-specific DNA-(adenine-N6)-methyltransferase [Spirobacillus cienkowskii]
MEVLNVNYIFSKPFLKWAGGKHKLVPIISEKLGDGKRLVEPFVGSGAVFMGTNFKSYLLCDTNNDLIDLYNNLKFHPDKLINEVIKLFNIENNAEERFYEIRNKFNEVKDSSIEKSAMFVYLNKHSFNGLCRYNSKGKFNVPFGRYKTVTAPINEMKLFAAKSEFALFECCDFIDTFKKLSQGDIVYCDPPYVPISITSNFTSYHANEFGKKQQQELANCAINAKNQGHTVVISNHDTIFTREIYANAKIDALTVRRSISSKAKTRGNAHELLATF